MVPHVQDYSTHGGELWACEAIYQLSSLPSLVPSTPQVVQRPRRSTSSLIPKDIQLQFDAHEKQKKQIYTHTTARSSRYHGRAYKARRAAAHCKWVRLGCVELGCTLTGCRTKYKRRGLKWIEIC